MKILLLIILTLFSGTLLAPGYNTITLVEIEAINPYSMIWEAVKVVELRGKPDTTINYKEMAYGPGQIHQPKLDDFNKETGKHYQLTDCLNETIAEEVFMHFAAKHHHEDILAISREWNGKSKTNKYYTKVFKQLNN